MLPTEIFVSTAELLHKAHKSLNRGALLLCVALAGADFFVVMLEVISRSAGATFVWTEELSRWLLVWMTFVGAGVVLKEGGHIRVEFFLSACPPKMGKAISIMGEIAIFMFLLSFTALAWTVSVDALRVKGDIILLPMLYPKFGMVVGGALMILNEIHVISTKVRSDRSGSQNT